MYFRWDGGDTGLRLTSSCPVQSPVLFDENTAWSQKEALWSAVAGGPTSGFGQLSLPPGTSVSTSNGFAVQPSAAGCLCIMHRSSFQEPEDGVVTPRVLAGLARITRKCLCWVLCLLLCLTDKPCRELRAELPHPVN